MGSIRPRTTDSASPVERTWAAWWPAILLTLATFVAYWPALSAGFIWDDDDYVTQNPHLADGAGLGRIWFDVRATPQYYPLVHTTFWIERRFWDLEATGYHLTNVALHACSAVLLWRILRRLDLPLAPWIAAFFALHPIYVESVAWITERKNVLSGCCYFAAALCYLRYAGIGGGRDDQQGASSGADKRRWAWYAATVALFVAALLSKTVTFSLPAALAVVLWWQRGELRRADWLSLVPLALLTIPPVLGTIWLEREHVGASGAEWELSVVEKLLVAGRIFWFYPAKIAWPVPLVFIYPRWTVDANAPWQYIYPAAAFSLIVLFWSARRRIGRGPLAATLFYAGTLTPALGFFHVYPMRYSFVADHFQYLPSVGILCLFAGCFDWGLRRCANSVARRGAALVGVALWVALGALTWRQCGIYQNLETLWSDTLAKNPDCWMAHANLAGVYSSQGRFADAERHFADSLRLAPRNVEAVLGLAALHSNRNEFDEADRYFRQAIELDPYLPAAHFLFGLHCGRRGDLARAAEHFERACELNPRFAAAHYYLGQAWFDLGRVDDARQQFETTLQLDPRHPLAHQQLGTQALQAGDLDRAIEHLKVAVERQPDLRSAHLNLALAYERKGLLGQAKRHRDWGQQLP